MIQENICYAIIFVAEALTAWLYVEYLFTRKVSGIHNTITFGVTYTILFLLFMSHNIALNAIMFFSLNSLLFYRNYMCSIKAAILHSGFLTFALTSSEILINLLLVGLGYDFTTYTCVFPVLLAMAIASKLLYLVFSVISSRLFYANKNSDSEPRQVVLFSIIPLFSTAITVWIIYLGLSNEITKVSELMMVITIFSLLFVNLIFIILHNILQKINGERLSLLLSLQKEHADTTYYQALQEQFDNQRILVHDIKNHFRTIDAMAQSNQTDEIQGYVAKLEASLAPSTYARLCSDPILNMILLRCRDDCIIRGIDFHCDVRDNISDFMDVPGITALYGNLLSNAIEAADSSDEKQIELSVIYNSEQNAIVISTVNSCDSAPILRNDGQYQSTKKNHMLHGIGLKSIARTVKKYDGISSMYYDQENRKFHHIIQLPKPSD